jgi:hypothetical protein
MQRKRNKRHKKQRGRQKLKTKKQETQRKSGTEDKIPVEELGDRGAVC